MVPFTLLILLIISNLHLSLGDQKCADYAKDIDYHHPTISYSSPKPKGVWVSSRCELVPKMKYITRRLDIQAAKWTSYIYHYSDSWCRKPTFTVKVTGSYEMLAATATPNSKASYGAKFHFSNVFIHAKNAKVVENVIRDILSKCPKALPDIPKMTQDYEIDIEDYVGKYIKVDVNSLLFRKSCRYYFVLHPYTYENVRMTGETNRRYLKRSYDVLYFASIYPYHLKRTTTSQKFQYGLSRINRPNCEVCQLMSKINNPDNPPVLSLPKEGRSFSGSWVSKTCEATDDKTFESKYYNFDYSLKRNDKRVFTAQHNYFSNADCKVKKFNLKFGGDFGNDTVHKKVAGVYEIKLYFKWITLTIYEKATLSLVRNGGSSCGDSDEWRIGVEQNLTESNGCKSLGFEIPSSLKAIFRVSKTRASQDLYLSFIEEGGTFFTSNLVSCNKATENYKKRLTTTKATPKKHIVPVDKNFKIDTTFKENSAGTRGKLNFLAICAFLIAHCVIQFGFI